MLFLVINTKHCEPSISKVLMKFNFHTSYRLTFRHYMNIKLSLNDNHFQIMKIYVSNIYDEFGDVFQLKMSDNIMFVDGE